MARGFSQAPGVSVEVLDAARRDLHRTRMASLAQSHNRAVRETIARRDDVPLGIQAVLAQDDAARVRVAVAGNAHTARSVLEHLGADRNATVVLALLTNPSVPFALVESLAFHRRLGIRRQAAVRLNDAGPAPRAEELQEEDALFPELRERATMVGAFSVPTAS